MWFLKLLIYAQKFLLKVTGLLSTEIHEWRNDGSLESSRVIWFHDFEFYKQSNTGNLYTWMFSKSRLLFFYLYFVIKFTPHE